MRDLEAGSAGGERGVVEDVGGGEVESEGRGVAWGDAGKSFGDGGVLGEGGGGEFSEYAAEAH